MKSNLLKQEPPTRKQSVCKTDLGATAEWKKDIDHNYQLDGAIRHSTKLCFLNGKATASRLPVNTEFVGGLPELF
jgi:hypothetical protein